MTAESESFDTDELRENVARFLKRSSAADSRKETSAKGPGSG